MGVTGLSSAARSTRRTRATSRSREAAKERFGLDRLLVLVAAAPGHKGVDAPAEDRLALARAAFPDEDVGLDDHARTVDLLRDERFDDPLFLIGADEFCDFPDWKDPNGVLELDAARRRHAPGLPARPHRERARPRSTSPSASSSSRSSRTRSPRASSRERLASGVRPLDGLVPPRGRRADPASAASIVAEAGYTERELRGGPPRP